MLIRPSDLPWWGWLLCWVGAGTVFTITMFPIGLLSEDKDDLPKLLKWLGYVISTALAGICILSFWVGIILFVKAELGT
jgi:hypothetical protein